MPYYPLICTFYMFVSNSLSVVYRILLTGVNERMYTDAKTNSVYFISLETSQTTRNRFNDLYMAVPKV